MAEHTRDDHEALSMITSLVLQQASWLRGGGKEERERGRERGREEGREEEREREREKEREGEMKGEREGKYKRTVSFH